jgi:hypothetical protein
LQLLVALVIVTILDAADSFVTNANSAGEDSQPLMTGDSNFAYAGAGVENVYYPQTTGDQIVSESASADMGTTSAVWPGEGANQWKTTDQATGNPSHQQVGFFDVIRSLTNIFTGLVGRASTPETPTPIDRGYYYQHSEEDTTDEDFYDDRVMAPVTDVPIAVRLARVKQLVNTRLAPRSNPNIYDGYPQYPPAVMEDPRQGSASAHQDVILTPGEQVSENFGCNSRICLWKK